MIPARYTYALGVCFSAVITVIVQLIAVVTQVIGWM